MAGQNTLQILLIYDANVIGKCCMGVLLRKSPFSPKLTQTLDLEETETHYGQEQNLECILPSHLLAFSNGVIP
jgi:hypothetical protein